MINRHQFFLDTLRPPPTPASQSNFYEETLKPSLSSWLISEVYYPLHSSSHHIVLSLLWCRRLGLTEIDPHQLVKRHNLSVFAYVVLGGLSG